ncbi:ceramidase domain-containing protein [Roseibium porphyridii]|uniref:Ceramidase domain-containing protein n=1 Tax=Roseibium porphyridii TaxID=2866279 RepID=A0ABY8F3C7_9HYPH|nr:ceramidase domain-containing protein [Roseibium sp. KMA01]WFE88884.1 ceramidase domain-containing protein [Roseibium sp. KMA01]
MALHEHVDNYCERVGPDFWSEPVNAITNAAFLVAAIAAFFLWRRKTPQDWPALVLIGVVFVIGVGSFLFHTFATRWAALADVLPIAIFIHVYLFFALKRFLTVTWWLALLIVVGFFLATPFVAQAIAPLVGSSAGYVPALVAIFVVGALFRAQNARLGAQVLITGIVFALSLAFRMLDEPICNHFAVGTHFLWHILNSIVLFALLRVLILHRAG